MLLLCSCTMQAQQMKTLSWTAEASTYYAVNTASKGSDAFIDLMNTAARTGAGLNILRGSIGIDLTQLHGQVALQYGDITKAVWGKQFLLQEGWIGYRIAPDIDLQAGAFLSHFGVEGLVPSQNYSGIVSTTGFFDPNYFGGIKCYVKLSEFTSAHLDVLTSFNGLEIDGDIPAVSFGIEYTPDTTTQLTCSSILSEEPLDDKTYQLYTQVSGMLRRRQWHLLGELNIGAELPSAATPAMMMTSALLGCYYDVTNILQVGLRAECVIDPHGIMADDRYARPLLIEALSSAGVTATVNYAAAPWCTIRADLRRLSAIDNISVIDANPPVRARTEAIVTVDLVLNSD